jgi:hypothetical protein
MWGCKHRIAEPFCSCLWYVALTDCNLLVFAAVCCAVLCRVPTIYDSDSGVLSISHTPECDAVQYAYFAPYTYNRHRNLIARMQVRAYDCAAGNAHGLSSGLEDAAVLLVAHYCSHGPLFSSTAVSANQGSAVSTRPYRAIYTVIVPW